MGWILERKEERKEGVREGRRKCGKGEENGEEGRKGGVRNPPPSSLRYLVLENMPSQRWKITYTLC